MARPITQTFTPKEFDKLTKTEKRLRGELATIKRSIKVREERIKKAREEKKELENRLKDLTYNMKDRGLYLPTITIEEYDVKGYTNYRGVYYVSGKKQQAPLGSQRKIYKVLEDKYDGFIGKKNKDKRKIVEEYLEPKVKLHYWIKQYDKKKE